jgi:hypothetical protein
VKQGHPALAAWEEQSARRVEFEGKGSAWLTITNSELALARSSGA